MEAAVIERMAPPSLKKMGGSGAMNEGNYASSKESTSLDVFSSDDLGLTLLPGPQTHKKDEGEKVQAAIGRDINICTTEQQEDDQSRQLELDERWQPAKKGSTVDDPIGGSCYFGLSKGVERHSSTAPHDDDALFRPHESCFGIQGKYDLQRNDFSLSTETLSKDSGNGHHYDRDPIPKQSGATHAFFLATEGREVERDVFFDSSNQKFKEEVRMTGLNEAKVSADSIVGNKHDSGRKCETTACENSLKYGFCGSKGRKSENLLRTTSSVNLGMTFTKLTTDNTLSTSYHLTRPEGQVERLQHSARSSESQFTLSVTTERNNPSHAASAFLASVGLQGSSKETALAHQQALDSLQLPSQQILKQPQASRNIHAAPQKKVSKPVKHVKRSWTRHFPTRAKDPPSKRLNSDDVHTLSATLPFSIGSGTYSNSLKTYFACESRCKLLAHPNPRSLASSPPIQIYSSPQASYGLDRHTSNNRFDTAIVQSRSKAGAKRSNSLPELCLPHQSIMYQQHCHQANQFPTPPSEPHVPGDNSQYPGSNQTFLPPNQEAHPVREAMHGNVNRPLTELPYQNMQGNFSQPSQSLSYPNMAAPVYDYAPVQLPVHGPSIQTGNDNPMSTNDGLANSNSVPVYTAAEYMALHQQFMEQSRRIENHMENLTRMRERDRISQAKIKEQERTIAALRQKSETTKTAKLPKAGIKTKSSGKGGVASTISWARQSHPIAGHRSTNARSFSLDSSAFQLRDQNDGPFLESRVPVPTMSLPTQSQHASVPDVATGFPFTQATQIEAPHSALSQPQAQYPSGSHNPAYPHNSAYPHYPVYLQNPGFPPYLHPLGQYSYPEISAEHPFLNQDNQFQPNPAPYSAENYQQPLQVPVSHALSAAVQAEASAAGIKRKGEAEPDPAQAVKRQQQPMVSQPDVSLQEGPADDDHAASEARRKMSGKDLNWLQGVNPYKDVSQDRQQQSTIASASLSQASPLPALAAQGPMGLIAPTPGEASKTTTQKKPNKRRQPMSAAEKKAARAKYNKTHREKRKEKKRIEGLQAAENHEASGTPSPPSNAGDDDDGFQSPFDLAEEENDGTEQIVISDDDDDLLNGSSMPEETATHDATEEIYYDINDLENPFGLSAEDLAFSTEAENMLMLEPDDPTSQGVEHAHEETDQSMMEVPEEKESEESEEE